MLAHALALIVAATLLGCDESADPADPATSPHCVTVRMKYLEDKFLIEQGAERGADATVVASAQLELDKRKSREWACFR